MKSAIATAALATAAIAAPAPLVKRDDFDVLNFALKLELLESTFYSEGLNTFNRTSFGSIGFTQRGFFKNLQKAARDEGQHVNALTAAVSAQDGATPATACTYDFGYKTAREFVKVASFLEGVGVSAYLGAVRQLSTQGLQSVGGSIMTTEARHSGFLRNNKKFSPFAQAFETPLNIDMVSKLASGYYVDCGEDNDASRIDSTLPNLTPRAPNLLFRYGQIIAFFVDEVPTGDNYQAGAQTYIAWPSANGPIYSDAEFDADNKLVRTTVPDFSNFGPTGQVYPTWVSSNTPTDNGDSNNPSDIATADILAGPTIVEVRSTYLD